MVTESSRSSGSSQRLLRCAELSQDQRVEHIKSKSRGTIVAFPNADTVRVEWDDNNVCMSDIARTSLKALNGFRRILCDRS
jgi:hypothetical protein